MAASDSPMHLPEENWHRASFSCNVNHVTHHLNIVHQEKKKTVLKKKMHKAISLFSSPTGLELPFMMMPHPLIPVSLPPASVTMAMSQMNHLSTIANMAAAAQVQSPPSRVETSVIKVTVEQTKLNQKAPNCTPLPTIINVVKMYRCPLF